MKAFLTLLPIFLFQAAHSQVAYDESVIEKYRIAGSLQSDSLQVNWESFKNSSIYNGTAIFLKFRIDTLNKNHFRPSQIILSPPDSPGPETFKAYVAPPDTLEGALVSFKSNADTMLLGWGGI